jgi:hypothetical protein
MTPISDTPDEVRSIIDDADAKLLLMQLGIIEKLLEHGKALKESNVAGFSKSHAATAYSPDHPTHWIMATYCSGFTNPTDNGFMVDCIPKSRCSFEQFRVLRRQHTAAIFPKGIETGEIGPVKPSKN